MLQFSKVLASLCAGCLCTLTIHQIPALGNVLLPQTHAIPETSPIRPVDVMPLEPLPTPAETAPAMSIPPTETQSPQTQTTAAVATAVTVLTATATTTIPPETTAATESETTVAVTSTIPESDPFFQEHETWFKAYMDYRTITNTDSVQYAMEQNAWTDDRGLRYAGKRQRIYRSGGRYQSRPAHRQNAPLSQLRKRCKCSGIHCRYRDALRRSTKRRDSLCLPGTVREYHCNCAGGVMSLVSRSNICLRSCSGSAR